MKITFLDAATLGTDISLDEFSSFGEVAIYQASEPEDVETRILDADVVITNKINLNEGNMQNAKKLKLICVTATGYDNIDTEYCQKRGIYVCNVIGYSTHCVAQVTLAMALSLATHLPEYEKFVSSGEYSKSNVANQLSPVYHELNGKTWGIIGLGNIGKQVARVAEAMGCHVLAYKRTPDKDFSCCSLLELCQKSDIISVHLPLSDETKGIIDQSCIDAMKNNVIFINVARGAVTDELALTNAVLSGKIGGLGVDVFTTEPIPNNHPFTTLYNHPNVCFTPHMAWGAYETRVRCLHETYLNIQAFLDGNPRNTVF